MSHGTVLIVDDHPDTCWAVVRLVQKLGYEAECVSSGSDALNYLSGHAVGLILLDYMMPEMDGLEVLSRLRHDPSLQAVPVVMHTALSDEMIRTRALVEGAQGFLVKGSYTVQDVRTTLAKYCAPATLEQN